MFPRPSRIFRLLIFVFMIFIFLIFYIYMLHNNYQDIKLKGLPHSFRQQPVISTSVMSIWNTSLPRKLNQTMTLARRRTPDLSKMIQEQSLLNFSALHKDNFTLNPHSFMYIHNPVHTCRGNRLKLLIYIHSSPINFKKRQAVRQTWGHPGVLSLFDARLIFILGGGYDESIQGLVDLEAKTYQDIVQEDFVDSYRNLTYKGIAALKWTATYCSNSDFLLKTDDDILIDIVSLLNDLFTNILPKRRSSTGLILCNLWTKMKVIRDPNSKWFISNEEFADEYFPAYCSGSAFLMSSELAPKMFQTALSTRFFWVDDFYVTGLLVKKLNIQHTRYNDAYLLNTNFVEDRIKNTSSQLKVFHVKKLSLFIKLWPYIVKRHKHLTVTFQLPIFDVYKNFSPPDV